MNADGMSRQCGQCQCPDCPSPVPDAELETEMVDQPSPSVTALPPDEGVEVADVDYVRDGWSVSWHSEIIHASVLSEGGRRSPLTDSVFPEASPFTTAAIRIDNSSALHPFFPHKSDVGPVRQMTIAHAFNCRMAVLRDGVKSAVCVGKSRKPKGCFLANSDIP